MADEQTHQGWLPPRAPAHPPPTALPRLPTAPPERTSIPERKPSSGSEVAALGLACASLLLLVFSAGVGFLFSGLVGAGALILGRRTGRRTAIVLAWIAVIGAIVAAIVWMILSANGYTPQDLQDWLQRQVDRQRR